MNSNEKIVSLIRKISIGQFKSSIDDETFMNELQIGQREIPEMDLLTCNVNLQNYAFNSCDNQKNSQQNNNEIKIKPAWKCTGRKRDEIGLGPLDELFKINQKQQYSDEMNGQTKNYENVSNIYVEHTQYNQLDPINYYESNNFNEQTMNDENNNLIYVQNNQNMNGFSTFHDNDYSWQVVQQNWNCSTNKYSQYSLQTIDSSYQEQILQYDIQTDDGHNTIFTQTNDQTNWKTPITMLGKLIDSDARAYL